MKLFKRLKLNKYKNLYLDEDKIRRYEALTPANDITNGQEYMAALDWALEQSNIHNIAISGPYGAGKSSVIETYLKVRNKKNALRISLAAFNLEEILKGKDESIDKKLEAGILKQLFYSVEAEKIPQSRYRKLQSESRWSNPRAAMIAIIILCAVVYYISPDKVKNFIDSVNSLPIGSVIAISGGLACIVWYSFTKIAGWFRKNGRIQEIKFFDKATVKAESVNEESVFDKNLDEIVYYFERTETEIVIIEDLDRFANTNIFVALRELNSILNNYEKINGKVRFIYAIKDDMFEKEGERTKFFDFIIPIVPYISSTNSSDILYDKLEFDKESRRSSIYKISGNFISMISPFISDMRDLICICNEFNVFKNTLKGNQELHNLDDEEMFALIVFKNLYPKDFAELENESSTSIVRMAFANKKRLIEQKRELIEEKKKSENEKIDMIDKEVLCSVRELKLALLGCLTNYESTVYKIDVDSNSYTFSQIIKDDFDINLLKGKRITIYPESYYGSRFPVDDVEETIKKNGGDYFERIEKMKKGLMQCKEESRRAIEEYEQKINGLRAYSMKQMLDEFDTEFLDEKVQGNKLLVFLLRHGYLNENYANYINYFHPKSITKEEMNFILGVRNHRAEGGYSYDLENVSQVFDRLQDFEFKQKEILNYDLVDYVLSEKEKSSSASMFIAQLANHSAESMSFIKAYIERGENLDIMIHHLCNRNRLFWQDISQDDGISLETRYKYLVLMLKYADMKDIVKQNVADDEDKGILTKFLTSHSDSLKNISDAPIDKQIELLEELGVVFANVETDLINEAMREEIFDNCRYEMNPDMIRRLFEWKQPEKVDEQTRKNYSLILQLGYEPAIDYVHDYFVDYVSDIVVGVETNTDEEIQAVEDIIVRLLPENEELCIEVLDKEPVTWDNINDCCAGIGEDAIASKRKIWSYLLENERIECTWYNFVAYYEERGVDEIWGKYFDKNIDILLDDTDNPVITEDILAKLLLVDMSAENYRKYVSNVKMKPYSGKIHELSETKVSILIGETVLPYTNEYWDDLGDAYPQLRVRYAEANRKDFIESLDNIKIVEKEINTLLISEIFSQADKEKLLEKLDVTTLGMESAMAIRTLEFLVKRDYVDAAWDVLEEENKYELLFNQMDNYNDDELPELFMQLADVYHPLADRTNHKIRLEHGDYNRKLLAKLQERGYITSYQEEWENQGIGKGKRLVYTARVKQAKS